MCLETANRIAKALLYEGYLLYPYTPSATKNRQRWTFGGIYPESYVARNPGSDAAQMQTECLMEAAPSAHLTIQVRFLHLIARTQGPRQEATPGFDVWEEACEREIALPEFNVWNLAETPWRHEFSFPEWRESEREFTRIQHPVHGALEISAERIERNLLRLQLRILNTTRQDPQTRSEALLHSMISAHSILSVREARFISSIDPPEHCRAAVAECRNTGTWPVLIGKPGDTSVMLSSPIILYDYPQIAPESPGDLFDSAEIDEILTLRILTLTEEEKAQIRATDERGRALLERTERLTPEELLRLHGRLRWTEKKLKPGDRVRIHPRRRADAFDFALDGMTARIESIEQDLEDGLHLSVTLDDDPGRDLGVMGQPGHRFFFGVDEVEPL